MKTLLFSISLIFASSSFTVQAQEFGRGLLLMPESEYQDIPEAPKYRAFLPPSVDLSSWFPVVGDQGIQSSCVAWATTYYMRSFYENRYNTSPLKPTPLSPAYVYNQLTRQSMNCQDGLSFPKAFALLKTKGAPPLASFPYLQATCNVQPDETVQNLASKYKVDSWSRLKKGSADDVKGEIANGRPIVFGMLTPNNFENLKGTTIYDDIGDSNEAGAHAMTVVGYDDSLKAFRIINSWGNKWADKGYAWVSYRSYEKHVRESYSVMVARNLVPVSVQPVTTPPVKPIEQVPKPPQPIVIQEVLPPKPQPVIVQVTPPPKPQPVVVTEPPEPAPLPKPPEPIQIKPQPVTLAQVQSNVLNSLKDMNCASVSVQNVKGQLQLSGFVGYETDVSLLKELITPLGTKGSSSVQLRPWPQCEGLITLAKSLTENANLNVTSNKRILKEGDKLSLEITTPSYPSFIYVSYLQVDGQVVHLHRYSDQGNKAIPANTKVVLGGRGQYVISGPTFGAESVFVVASAIPLLSIERPQVETERDYLTQFRLAILAHQSAKGKVSSAFLPLVTSK